MKRRILIHSENPLKPVYSKLECELIRYLSGEIIGIIDQSNSGKTVQEVLGFGGEIPIASTLDEFLTQKPNYILIGASSFKGTFPMEWYPMVIKALQMRIHILNGLHQPLSTLAEFDLLAKKYKAKIVDLRDSGAKPTKFKNISGNIQAKKILVAGSNAAAGTLSTILELVKIVHKNGISADWVATGLSSTLIKGKGFIAESLIADLISGYVENELVELDRKFEYLLVESQGHFHDAIKAPVFWGILHGTVPDAMVLCHQVESANEMDAIQKEYDNYSYLLNQINGAPIIGLALDTTMLDENQAHELIKNAKFKFRVPVFDPLRSDLKEILFAFKNVEKLK